MCYSTPSLRLLTRQYLRMHTRAGQQHTPYISLGTPAPIPCHMVLGRNQPQKQAIKVRDPSRLHTAYYFCTRRCGTSFRSLIHQTRVCCTALVHILGFAWWKMNHRWYLINSRLKVKNRKPNSKIVIRWLIEQKHTYQPCVYFQFDLLDWNQDSCLIHASSCLRQEHRKAFPWSAILYLMSMQGCFSLNNKDKHLRKWWSRQLPHRACFVATKII